MAIGPNAARSLVYDSARPLKIRPLFQALPSQLRTAGHDAERLGLRVVDEHRVVLAAAEIAVARILAVDPDRRLLCEIVAGFPADAPAPVWQCITLLERGEGLLLTTTHHPMPLATGEIVQCLPGSDPGQLLTAHRVALNALQSLGVESLDVTDARATSAVAHHLLGQPARDDRRGTSRTLRANLRQHRDAALGPIHHQPDLAARLDEFCSGRR